MEDVEWGQSLKLGPSASLPNRANLANYFRLLVCYSVRASVCECECERWCWCWCECVGALSLQAESESESERV